MTTDKPDVLSIYSARDVHELGAACRLDWQGREWFAPLQDVRQTAEDLFTCAAYADLIGELLTLGMDAPLIAPMLQSMLRGRKPAYFGAPTTVFLLPGGSSERKAGVVLLGKRDLFHKGKADGMLTAEEAREMGRFWLAAAEASEQDTLFDRVLRRAGWLGDTELDVFFELLADIREGKDQLTGPS